MISARETVLDIGRRAPARFLAELRAAGVRVRPGEVIADRGRRPLSTFSSALRAAVGEEAPAAPMADEALIVSPAFYRYWRRVTA